MNSLITQKKLNTIEKSTVNVSTINHDNSWGITQSIIYEKTRKDVPYSREKTI